MLISWDEVCRNAPPIRGIIHIGAHRAEERTLYLARGLTKIIWVEADPKKAAWLAAHCDSPSERVFNYAMCDQDHVERVLYLAENDGASSSLLWPKEHVGQHPGVEFRESITVPTITLDTLLAERGLRAKDYNFISMDIQGAELLALKGMTKTLPHIDTIYTEVNFIEMYEGCGLVDELDTLLSKYNLERRLTYDTGLGWGDALYVKR